MSNQAQLNDLATYLASKREHILNVWRRSVWGDPELATASRQPRAALDDHIPAILQCFERRLRSEHSIESLRVELEARNDAAEHAIQRWERGYDFREAVREWGHLQLAILDQLDRYAEIHPEVETGTMTLARRLVIKLTSEGISESSSKYLRLLKSEADNRLTDLQESLDTLQAVENERAALLRQAAHDLRGNVGVISNVSTALRGTQISEKEREVFHGLLERGVESMASLLGEMMQLARLETNSDPLRLEKFDAAVAIRQLCDLMRSTADDHKLFLKCSGPDHLLVEGDPIKLQRIIQNLAINAIKATERGGIEINWRLVSDDQWELVVKDSGRGFDLTSTVEPNAAQRQGAREPGPGPTSSGALPASEGIGLSIVKRLCSLLEADVEIESAADRGTIVTMTFPVRYGPESE